MCGRMARRLAGPPLRGLETGRAGANLEEKKTGVDVVSARDSSGELLEPGVVRREDPVPEMMTGREAEDQRSASLDRAAGSGAGSEEGAEVMPPWLIAERLRGGEKRTSMGKSTRTGPGTPL